MTQTLLEQLMGSGTKSLFPIFRSLAVRSNELCSYTPFIPGQTPLWMLLSAASCCVAPHLSHWLRLLVQVVEGDDCLQTLHHWAGFRGFIRSAFHHFQQPFLELLFGFFASASNWSRSYIIMRVYTPRLLVEDRLASFPGHFFGQTLPFVRFWEAGKVTWLKQSNHSCRLQRPA